MSEENKSAFCCICFTRIVGIRKASAQHGDGLSDKLKAYEGHVVVYSNCIKTYCSTDHIQRVVQKRLLTETSQSQSSQLSPKRLRSNQVLVSVFFIASYFARMIVMFIVHPNILIVGENDIFTKQPKEVVKSLSSKAFV